MKKNYNLVSPKAGSPTPNANPNMLLDYDAASVIKALTFFWLLMYEMLHILVPYVTSVYNDVNNALRGR